MNPAEQVGLVLAEAKRSGWPFHSAWRVALQSLPRDGDPEMEDWRLQLVWARAAFWAAYERRDYYVMHRNTNVSTLGIAPEANLVPHGAVVRHVRAAA